MLATSHKLYNSFSFDYYLPAVIPLHEDKDLDSPIRGGGILVPIHLDKGEEVVLPIHDSHYPYE